MEPEQEEEATLLEFTEAAIEHIRSVYPHSDEDVRKDLLELAEQVLQYLILLDDAIDSDLFTSVRDLVTIMSSNQERSTAQRKGRPEISIGEDQLRYLVEQGFRVKDISDMFKDYRTKDEALRHYSSQLYTVK